MSDFNSRNALEPKRYTLSEFSEPQFFLFEGLRLAYHDPDAASEKPAVVCLHAIGHGSRDFEAFRSFFKDTYRVVTLDWPNHGRSESDSVAVSIERFSYILDHFIRSLKLKKFVIVGNSIGGGAAVKFATSQHPRLKGLILCNPAGLDKGGILAYRFSLFIERQMHLGSQKKRSFSGWYRRYYKNILITEKSREQRERIIESCYEMAESAEQAWRSFRSPESSLRKFVTGVRVTTVFAWAKKDRIVRWSRCKAAVNRFQKKQILFFDAGHAPFLETPEEFCLEFKNILVDFFK